MTYEKILDDALKRVDNKYSKRQDSPIFNGVAPACYEISKVYEIMEEHLKQSFGMTANGVYLNNLVKEVGLERFEATYAIKKAEFKDKDDRLTDIDLNLRFAKDEYSFVVIKKIEKGIFYLKCEQPGSAANEIMGDILPIDNVSIASAKIIANVELGTDIEDDEHLRLRYLQKVREPATSGNIYHYRLWAMEVENIGAAKIFPLWNGNGTVKVMIVNSDMKSTDTLLINKVKNHIEDVRPIGATVTVVTPSAKDITITAKIRTSLNANMELTRLDFKAKIEKYIKDITKEYFSNIRANSYFISLAQVGKHLLESKDVIDYAELKLNNVTANIELSAEQIGNIASITLEVM